MSDDDMVSARSVLRAGRRRLVMSESSEDSVLDGTAPSKLTLLQGLSSMQTAPAADMGPHVRDRVVSSLAAKLHATHIVDKEATFSKALHKSPSEGSPMRLTRTVQKAGRGARVLHDSDDENDTVRYNNDKTLGGDNIQMDAVEAAGLPSGPLSSSIAVSASPTMMSAASSSMGDADTSMDTARESCASSSKPHPQPLLLAGSDVMRATTLSVTGQLSVSASPQRRRSLSPLRLGSAWPPWRDSRRNNEAQAAATCNDATASSPIQAQADDGDVDDALCGGDALGAWYMGPPSPSVAPATTIRGSGHAGGLKLLLHTIQCKHPVSPISAGSNMYTPSPKASPFATPTSSFATPGELGSLLAAPDQEIMAASTAGAALAASSHPASVALCTPAFEMHTECSPSLTSPPQQSFPHAASSIANWSARSSPGSDSMVSMESQDANTLHGCTHTPPAGSVMYTALPGTQHPANDDVTEATSSMDSSMQGLLAQLRMISVQETPAQALREHAVADTAVDDHTVAEWASPTSSNSPDLSPGTHMASPGSQFDSPTATMSVQEEAAGGSLLLQEAVLQDVHTVPGMAWDTPAQLLPCADELQVSDLPASGSAAQRELCIPAQRTPLPAQHVPESMSQSDSEEEAAVMVRSVCRPTGRHVVDSDSESEPAPSSNAPHRGASPHLAQSYVTAAASTSGAHAANIGTGAEPSNAKVAIQRMVSWQQAGHGSDSESEGHTMARSVRRPTTRRIMDSDSGSDAEAEASSMGVNGAAPQAPVRSGSDNAARNMDDETHDMYPVNSLATATPSSLHLVLRGPAAIPADAGPHALPAGQRQEQAEPGSSSDEERPMMTRSVRRTATRRVMSDSEGSEEEEEAVPVKQPAAGRATRNVAVEPMQAPAVCCVPDSPTAVGMPPDKELAQPASPPHAALIQPPAGSMLQSPWSCFKPIRRVRKVAAPVPATQLPPPPPAAVPPSQQLRAQKPLGSPLFKPSVHFQVPALKPLTTHTAEAPALMPPAAAPSGLAGPALQSEPPSKPRAAPSTHAAADVINLLSSDESESEASSEDSSEEESVQESSSSWSGASSDDGKEDQDSADDSSGDDAASLQPKTTAGRGQGVKAPARKPVAPAPVEAVPLLPPSTSRGLAAAPARRQRMSAEQKQFLESRPAVAQALYSQWNEAVFGGRLPQALPIVWNPRLVSTAGQVLDDNSRDAEKMKLGQKIPCRLELSSKILDTLPRLRTTLAHEMCHVAAWALDAEWSAPHGAAFWRWADALMAYEEGRVRKSSSSSRSRGAGSSGRSGKGAHEVQDGVEEEEEEKALVITRLHNFQTHMPHRWQCANTSCNKVYSRHRNSIDPVRHVCSKCQGRLTYLGKFGKNNKLLSGGPAGTPAGGGGGAAGGQTPNAYALFMKEHFTAIKAAHPPGTPMGTIMKAVGSRWSALKTAQKGAAGPGTAAANIAASPAPGQLGAAGGGEPVGGAAATGTARKRVLLPPGIPPPCPPAAVVMPRRLVLDLSSDGEEEEEEERGGDGQRHVQQQLHSGVAMSGGSDLVEAIAGGLGSLGL